MAAHLRLAATAWLAVAAALVGELEAARRIRLVTFNCEILAAPGERVTISKYRFDKGRYDQFERIAAVIESLEPDIINLEEVTSKDSVDLLVKILHAKGLTDYRGYHVDGHDNFMKLDVACITRLTPDKVEGEHIRCIWSPRDDPTWREEFTYARDDTVRTSSASTHCNQELATRSLSKVVRRPKRRRRPKSKARS